MIEVFSIGISLDELTIWLLVIESFEEVWFLLSLNGAIDVDICVAPDSFRDRTGCGAVAGVFVSTTGVAEVVVTIGGDVTVDVLEVVVVDVDVADAVVVVEVVVVGVVVELFALEPISSSTVKTCFVSGCTIARAFFCLGLIVAMGATGVAELPTTTGGGFTPPGIASGVVEVG